MTETKTFVARLREYARGGRQSETETLLTEAADRIEHLAAACREPDRVARIIRNVAEWTDESRLGLFAALKQRFCEGCGRAQPKEGPWCQCQNDE
jgi:hypothetical protein